MANTGWVSGGSTTAASGSGGGGGYVEGSGPLDLQGQPLEDSTGPVTLPAAESLAWQGRTQASSPADGMLLLTPTTSSDPVFVKLGGTTSSFAGIKSVGNTLAFRLADDSGPAAIAAASLSFASGVVDSAGSGAPNGSVVGSVGSLYRRTDGSAGTSFYVKESGSNNNAGWVPLVTSIPASYVNASGVASGAVDMHGAALLDSTHSLQLGKTATPVSATAVGDVVLGGRLEVQGATYLQGVAAATLSTSGAAALNSASVSTTLSVTGTSTFAGVTAGATSVSTLSTSAAATLNSASVSTTLSVTGNSTLAGVTAGATSVSTLSTSALATLNSASVSTTLSVTGNSTLAGVTAGATSVSTLSTSALATLNSASVSSTLSVTGGSTLAGVSATTLSTSAAATLNSASVSTTLSVTGNSTLAGVTASGQIIGPLGTVTAPSHTLLGQLSSGMYWDATHSGLALSNAGSQVMYCSGTSVTFPGALGSSGNVSFGGYLAAAGNFFVQGYTKGITIRQNLALIHI